MTRPNQKIMRYTVCLIIGLFTVITVNAQVLKRGFGPEPDSLDIHQAQGLSAIHLLREIREGLITYDAHGEPAAGVAERWQVSEDQLEWHFELRQNARWSNGDPVVASDFVRAWQRALTPTSVARNASLLAGIEGAAEIMAGQRAPESLAIHAVSDHQLKVTLHAPLPWFTEILAHPVTFPLHALGLDDPRGSPVNGAFEIAHATPHAVVGLKPNPYFHSADGITLEAVELYPIEDPASELSRYRAGELHITETIPPGRYEWLQEHHGDALRIAPYLGSFWLGYNLSNPMFSNNANLRKALSLALDRETLVRVILGAGEVPAWGIVPPGLAGHDAISAPGMDKAAREAEARRLFELAGFSRNSPPHIELRYNTSSQHRRMAVAVSAMWKQVLGVTTTLINEEWKVFVNNRAQGVLTQVFRGGWIADYADPTTFLDLFRSEHQLNWSRWSDERYDALMTKSDNSSGLQRSGLLQQAETLLMRDTPVIPLYYYVSRHLVAPDVKGYHDNIRDIHLSRYLEVEASP